MKVSELTGAMLDEWVARAEGYSETIDGGWPSYDEWAMANDWAPSTNWQDAGPIIERERIDINTDVYGWTAYIDIKDRMFGDTALEAAMRAFVASRFGPEVPDVKEPQ